jgi:hypothetical protein
VRFQVRFLRYRGRILPWREIANRPALVGDLRIEDWLDGHGCAVRIHIAGRQSAIVPKLPPNLPPMENGLGLLHHSGAV